MIKKTVQAKTWAVKIGDAEKTPLRDDFLIITGVDKSFQKYYTYDNLDTLNFKFYSDRKSFNWAMEQMKVK